MSILNVKDVNQYYGGSHILRNVSVQAHMGKVTVLLGRNGVGKTTLLKSLMGLVPIKTGSIEFDGKPIERTTPYERARAGIGFVPQGREIFARLFGVAVQRPVTAVRWQCGFGAPCDGSAERPKMPRIWAQGAPFPPS